MDVKAKLMKLVCRKIKVNGVEGAIVHGGQVDNLRKFIKVADNKLAISAEKCDTDAASSCNMAVPFKDESYDFSCKIDGKTIDIPWINENGKTELESVEDFVRKIKNWCGYVYSTSDANCKRELFIESL